MKSLPRFMYACSEENAEMLYATQFFVPDPFLWWEFRGKTAAVLSPLEIDRAKRDAEIDRIYGFEQFLEKGVKSTPLNLLTSVCQKLKFKALQVPSFFPAGLVEGLRRNKIRVEVSDDSFFPQRRFKSNAEVQKIRRGVELATIGLLRGQEVLKASKIRKDRKLSWGNQILTSEILRGEIDSAIVRANGLPANTIVAGGNQACDPHERGSGVLFAHQAIILDIFPRDPRTGYYGDLTRTFVRGRAPEKLRHLYETVKEGKAWVMKEVKPGRSGAEMHKELVERFKKGGYPTKKVKGRWVGFFHGIGHGLGMEVHESPRFSETHFTPGEVVTVEPGIYYPGIGGVRLEDVVVVHSKGVRNLTNLPEVLEIF
ncbi:MAG: Xaa-Pro peptidase family protein [Verrucomicrobiota bacterium]